MDKICISNGREIEYSVTGHGSAIVLIHGFLETKEIWGNFADLLSNKFKVIAVNMPGHGKSQLHERPFSMCKYAETALSAMDAENIEKAVVVGHSMGGYAAVAFAENYPERLSALCLFHSHPYADDQEKKLARNNMIKEFESGRGEAIIKTHTKNLFASQNAEKFEAVIQKNFDSAMKMDLKSIVSSIETMRDRKDRAFVTANLKQPFLLIHGMKDNFISNQTAQKMQIPETGKKIFLQNSGHAGFEEEPEAALSAIFDLLLSINR